MTSIVFLQSTAGGGFIGVGIAQVLQGHKWGYLLIAAGLNGSALYWAVLVRTAILRRVIVRRLTK